MRYRRIIKPSATLARAVTPGEYVRFGDGPYWNDVVSLDTPASPPSVCIQVKRKGAAKYYENLTYYTYNILNQPTERTCQAGMAYIPFTTVNKEFKYFQGPDLETDIRFAADIKVGLLMIDIWLPETVTFGASTPAEIMTDTVNKMFSQILPEYIIYDGHVYSFYNNWLPEVPAGLSAEGLYRFPGWAKNLTAAAPSTASLRTMFQKTPAGRWKGYHYSNCELGMNELERGPGLNNFFIRPDGSITGLNTRYRSTGALPGVWENGVDDITYQQWDYGSTVQRICSGISQWGVPYVLTPENAGDAASSNYGLYVNAYGIFRFFGTQQGSVSINGYCMPYCGYNAYGRSLAGIDSFYEYLNLLYFGCYGFLDGRRILCFDSPDATLGIARNDDGSGYLVEGTDPISSSWSRRTFTYNYTSNVHVRLITPIMENMLYESFDTREVPMQWIRDIITT